MKEGFRSALALDIGIIASDFACIVFSYAGISTLLHDEVHKKFFLLGGGSVLIVMGIIKLIRKDDTVYYDKEGKRLENKILKKKRSHPLYLALQGFLYNLMNPATLLFWLSTTSAAVGLYGGSRKMVFTQFGTTLATVFFTDTLKAFFAKMASRFVTPKFLKITRQIIGLIFIAFGVGIIFNYFSIID